MHRPKTRAKDLAVGSITIPEAGDQAVSEGAKKSNHALDVMGLDPKKLGFLPRTE
jgi:hypothetical protein